MSVIACSAPVIRDERKIVFVNSQSSNSNSAFFTNLTVDDKAALCVTDNKPQMADVSVVSNPFAVRSKHTPMIIHFSGLRARKRAINLP